MAKNGFKRYVKRDMNRPKAASRPLLNPFSRSGGMRIHYGLELDEISLYPPLCYHKAHELARSDSECAFQRVKFHAVSLQ